jgi:MFS family permease
MMRQSPRVTLAALSLSVVVYGLIQCLVIPALPAIQQKLHASPNSASWVLTAFLISASVATPTIGRLGDMYGKERALLISLAILAVGTVVCALAESMTVLIGGRIIQGVAGGFIPVGFAIVRDEFPPERVATGLALLASGSGIGVLLAGPIVDGLGFRWLFWVPLFLTFGAFVGTLLFVPESPIRTRGRVDWLGATLLALGLMALLVAVTETSAWGWFSVRTLLVLMLAVLLLYAWVRVELHVTQPLVDMRMMANRAVWTTNLVALLVGVGMYPAFVLIPEYVH